MYCFQNPFSRAARGVSGNPLNGKCAVANGTDAAAATTANTTTGSSNNSEPTKPRRSSEATSEGSGSSSIRYIDQLSGASSTDTLPGVRNDYLDNELLMSPGPTATAVAAVAATAATECLASPTIVFTSEDCGTTRTVIANGNGHHHRHCSPTRAGAANGAHNDAEPCRDEQDDEDEDGQPSHNGDAEAHRQQNGGKSGRWRRKLLLKLRSTDSSTSSNGDAGAAGGSCSSATPSPASDCSSYSRNGLNGAQQPKQQKQRNGDQRHKRAKQLTALSPRHARRRYSATATTNGGGDGVLLRSRRRHGVEANGFVSDDDYDDDDVDDVDDVEDEEEEEEDDDDYEEYEEEDTCNLEETEPEDNASSLPSSPAAPATVGLAPTGGPVPYYGFLSVNGGAMRQESTSTSSPQLSSSGLVDEQGGGSITSSRRRRSGCGSGSCETIVIGTGGGGGGGVGCGIRARAPSADCCSGSLIDLDDTASLRDEKQRSGSNETVSVKSCHHLKPSAESGLLLGHGLEATSCLPVARSCPNLERQSAGFCSSASGSSSPSPSPGPAGPRFKPIEEGDIQVCYLNHTRTLVSKILSSRFLRRWETHHLYLNDACLSSKTLTGFLQQPVPYSSMTEVYAVARWDPTYKYCLRIVLPDGSLLLQASNAYTRDQWYHSILWKKSIFKYQHLVSVGTKEEVVLRELKALVDFALWTPLQDERVAGAPLESVAKLLEEPNLFERSTTTTTTTTSPEDKSVERTVNGHHHGSPSADSTATLEDGHPDQAQHSPQSPAGADDHHCPASPTAQQNDARGWAEAVLSVAAPLLERAAPPPALARVLARLARLHPRSALVPALAPAVTRCLKHTVDFGKSPDMRRLLQVFVAALHEAEDGGEGAVRDYVASVHGPGSDCPHPRILPNLVSICVAAIFHRFEVTNSKDQRQQTEEAATPTSLPPLTCYLLVLNITSEYADWRPGLGALLQPVPFPEDALADPEVQDTVLSCVMRRLAKDPRCTVHRVLLPVREPRPGWIHIAAPSSPACPDEGQLFGEMLTTLLACCCRRKRFISSLLKQTGGACILLGVRDCDAAQEALCLMLEWRLLPNEEARLQVVSALQSTETGKSKYAALCQRQRNLQELQQKGGPRKLTLPVRATDADVALLLGGGALGNLECLSLAFTSVTSACAEQLIKLPALRYLNLWATQFGDTGLQMISEHLQKLQVLNLCETPVSDKGISTLASLTNLRKLNLNSTKLSASTFETLKKRLPALQEFDVRYTEAW